MENELFTNESSVLYQNRFCQQENFDIIINTGVPVGNHRFNRGSNHSLNRIDKLKSPNFTSFDTLVSLKSKSFNMEKTLNSGSSIWVTCNQETKKETIDDFKKMAAKSYDLSNNLLQLPDISYRYCVCLFMKNIYVMGGGNCINHNDSKTCLKYTTRGSK